MQSDNFIRKLLNFMFIFLAWR